MAGIMQVLQRRGLLGHFWGVHISAMNPHPEREIGFDEANPLIVQMGLNEQPTFAALSRVINRVQRHACTEAYCLRKRRLPAPAGPAPTGPPAAVGTGAVTADKECRFHVPRAHHEERFVIKHPGRAYFQFDTAGNDSRHNNYNRTVALAWLANTDISPCTSVEAVL